MNLLNGKIKNIYFKYLAAAFGSALITSIYTIVDTAMVGQYHGPDGAAALAVVSPIWNIIYSLGLLMGIGGSVVFSTLRGESEENIKRSNQFFTASVIGGVIVALIAWLCLIFWDDELLYLFGANETLLPLAKDYLLSVKYVVPSFLFTQLLAAYLRNDNAPALATKAVLAGGIFNVFGDYFFVFTCDMGMFGAGLATAIGSLLSLAIMISHFFTKKSTIYFEKPIGLPAMLGKITATGFSTFFIDVAMGIMTMLFNRQIMKYLGTDALAVYGIIINISTVVQCCAYSVGQASQPIISTNFGAKQGSRIRETLKYAIFTSIFFGVLWTALMFAIPNVLVKVFMTPTESVLEIAPAIIRTYGISFILLPINVFSTYYFQSVLKPTASFVVSVARGAVISGAFIMLLPSISPNALWYAMPITELLVFLYVIVMMRKYTKALPETDRAELPKNRIITVGREFGSGGRELGKRLADALGVPCYDKEIIHEVAALQGITPDKVEHITQSDIRSIYPATIGRTLSTPIYYDNNAGAVLGEMQNVIRRLAAEGDCVIVGCQADIILQDMAPFSIFVYADKESKLRRCLERAESGETEKTILEQMERIDKARSSARQMLSDSKWGAKESYHLMIDTSGMDIKVKVPYIVEKSKSWFDRNQA